MGKRFNIWENLDLPGESIPGQVLVEITGENRVLIEHHHGVWEYSHEQIGINVKYGTVQVSGTNLRLCSMTKAQLVISGKIDGITLIRRCEK